jgi:DNA-binding IclR family transcriptional regulator
VDSISGVGVIDKAWALITALRAGPAGLTELVERCSLPRATAHRLALALEVHQLVRRDIDGRFALGFALVGLGHDASASFPLVEAARPVLEDLRRQTGESVQLYVRDGDQRVCIAALDSVHELRTIVPVGAMLPLDRGSAGRALASEAVGWIESVAEREAGVASVSALIFGARKVPLAAISVSGPIERMTKAPGKKHGHAVVAAAARLSIG